MTTKELVIKLQNKYKTREEIIDICTAISCYKVGSEMDEGLELLAAKLDEPFNFRECAYELANRLESPEKEWYKIYSLIGEFFSVTKKYKESFNQLARVYLKEDGAESIKKNRIKGLLLDEYCRNYKYGEAERLASELIIETEIPIQTAYILGDFYMKTRRYDITKKIVREVLDTEQGRIYEEKFLKLSDEADAREKGKQSGGKAPYIPNKREVKELYLKFMEEIGLGEGIISSKGQSKSGCISREEYPPLHSYKGKPLKDFVAFDLETTGFSDKIDSITEIGAIKVVDGQIAETAGFTFQELVQPMFGRKIPRNVQQITGITNEMVANARTIQEVFFDFAKFIGDNVLVGYNNAKFDNRMLIRAGRYSFTLISNEFVDVMPQAKEKLVLDDYKLNTVSESLGIKSPQAHRALVDAVTTARVYLKLWEGQRNYKELRV